MKTSELRKMSGEEMKRAISKMSRAEIKTVLDSCGTPQEKIGWRKIWESVTGNKY